MLNLRSFRVQFLPYRPYPAPDRAPVWRITVVGGLGEPLLQLVDQVLLLGRQTFGKEAFRQRY